MSLCQVAFLFEEDNDLDNHSWISYFEVGGNHPFPCLKLDFVMKVEHIVLLSRSTFVPLDDNDDPSSLGNHVGLQTDHKTLIILARTIVYFFLCSCSLCCTCPALPGAPA